MVTQKLCSYAHEHILCLNFSFFYDTSKGIKTIKPYKNIGFEELIRIYKSDKLKELTEKLRATEDETEKAELKKQLPFFTPMGTFNDTRANINLSSFNCGLICLDIDGLQPHQVQHVRFILENQQSTLLCATSPRGKGVKALILISSYISKEHCYNQLKLNKYHIAESLELKEYVSKIDDAQFKPTQPCFISYDDEIYVNTNARGLNINLIKYIEPIIPTIETDFLNIKEKVSKTIFKEPINYRIQKYFENSTNSLIKFFALCSEGNRHSSIIKVQAVASWIHYAPQIESEIKDSLLSAVIGMYGTIQNAEVNNAVKSFERAWNTAPIKRNATIESIIDDKKYELNIIKS